MKVSYEIMLKQGNDQKNNKITKKIETFCENCPKLEKRIQEL